MGGVWEPVNLIPVSADSENLRPTGKVLRILYDAVEKQVFLVCDNGELVTLPDCPRCVKVKRVTAKPVADGRIDSGSKEIVMLGCDGTEYRVPLKEAVQYRAAADYIKRHLVNGGYLVDVRDRYMSGDDPVENSVSVPLEDLPEWLENLPHNTVLAFFCKMGTRSDKAVEYARRKGFARAYSLGGLRDISDELSGIASLKSGQ
jgi:rhodanese-related sulfurtransferase